MCSAAKCEKVLHKSANMSKICVGSLVTCSARQSAVLCICLATRPHEYSCQAKRFGSRVLLAAWVKLKLAMYNSISSRHSLTATVSCIGSMCSNKGSSMVSASACLFCCTSNRPCSHCLYMSGDYVCFSGLVGLACACLFLLYKQQNLQKGIALTPPCKACFLKYMKLEQTSR